jgi:ATP-dependent Clp protease adaptor protein ClpS
MSASIRHIHTFSQGSFDGEENTVHDQSEDAPSHFDLDGQTANSPPKPPTATQPPAPTRRTTRPKPGKLPPWKVVLHNDQIKGMQDVVITIKRLTPLSDQAAVRRMLEAHARGRALLLTTHRERAELYKYQFASRGLTVTIAPA